MSKHQIAPPVHVIVRAWGDEPVDLWLYAVDNKPDTAYVGRTSCARPIGLPVHQVFRFDDEMMARLSVEYSKGSDADMSSVYAMCCPISTIDNLIPSEIGLAHDEIAVAHPQRTESGNRE